jgi:hypothetical protein
MPAQTPAIIRLLRDRYKRFSVFIRITSIENHQRRACSH